MNQQDMKPEISTQRQILEAKRDQLKANAFESELNGNISEVTVSFAASDQERSSIKENVKRQRLNAKQLYAGARECQRLIDQLPKEEPKPEESSLAEVEAELDELAAELGLVE